MKNKILLGKTLSAVLLSLFLGHGNANCSQAEEVDLSSKMVVTIDGGSATKKSPVSRAIAKKFDLLYLESGALYRTVTHVLMKADLKPAASYERKISKFLSKAKLECSVEDGIVQFTVNGVRLSAQELRAPEINANVAKYTSMFKSISDFCTKGAMEVLKTEEFAKHKGIIAEGRTCGTHLFPDADLKFWFMASENAKVDFRKNVEKEDDDPIERDRLDSSRSFYQMAKPKAAIVIWTSSRVLKKNISMISAFIEQKLDDKIHSFQD